jgi:hypothetical protein
VGENPPLCEIDPVTIDYDTVLVGSFMDTVFTIANVGGGTLTGSVSESCDHYSIESGGGPYSLTAGQYVTVTVRFAPGSAGTHNCTVDTGTDCTNVSCTGVGEDLPSCQVIPASVDFDTVRVGASKDTTFTVTNTGGGVLTGNVSESCDHYSIVSNGGAFGLAAGESLVVTVRFEPDSSGTHNCSIETGSALCSDVTCMGVGKIVTSAGSDSRSYPLALHQNHPNPFNPATRIGFTLTRESRVMLEVFDVAGKRIKTLVDRSMVAGRHSEMWDGTDNNGNPVPSGIYIYRLKTGDKTLSRKCALLK